MPCGALAARGYSMTKAVFDTSVLVSAFLSRDNPGGVSTELLRFVINGPIDLHLSIEILDEAVEVLLRSTRARRRYGYNVNDVGQYRADLMTLATIVVDPPPTPGAVPRDSDDDKIIACAVAAGAEYLVARDHDLLSLATYGAFRIITPEEFLGIVRRQP